MRFKVGRNGLGTIVELNSATVMNPHMFIVGTSGSGKSYFLRGMVEQAVTQGAHVVVFDASRDWSQYLTSLGEGLALNGLRVVDVRGMDVSFNPLLPHIRADGVMETTSDVGNRVGNLLANAYRLKIDTAVYLENAITDYLRMTGHQSCSLAGLAHFMCSEPEIFKRTKVSIARLVNLANVVNCGEYQTDWLFSEPGLTIIDFGGLSNEQHQALITELIVGEIWEKRLRCNSADVRMPLILVCDEAQKFRFGESTNLVRVLREGRKFGLAGWFATQYIDNPLATNALDLAAFRPIFRPAPRQVGKIVNLLGCQKQAQKAELTQKLISLQRGEYLVQDVKGQIHDLFVE